MPIATTDHKIVMRGHKICRTCCSFACPDPNGCVGLAQSFSVELHGTPWDGVYTVRLHKCGCDYCPDYECFDEREGGSVWRYTGPDFVIDLGWQCLPAPNGQFWAVFVRFYHEGIWRQCIVRLAGVTDPCAPEGVYEDCMCSDDEVSLNKCWTTWCSSFWAEVGSVETMAFAKAAQPASKSGCRSCRGLA